MMIYNLSNADLAIGDGAASKKRAELVLEDKYKGITLHGRIRHKIKLSQPTRNSVYSCLFTRYGLDTGTEWQQEHFQSLFPKEVEVWAKATISNADKVHAAALVEEDLQDHRDATFVRYLLLVDKMGHRRYVTPEFEPTECFGRLKYILKFDLPAGITPLVTQTTTLVLAIIQSTEVVYETPLKIPYFDKFGRSEAVDMTTVMCIVGRVKDHRGRWAIVDRSELSSTRLWPVIQPLFARRRASP
ncbi:hypothetical protein BJ322DRAFT_1016127 [Thelephora terrestris]|uniref:Uncharacterized protein n=1 Tax=Thelephora terrestris TaxID=56493 RepID=A0A9P6HPZ3_9AGAM|nr:hypothetical protein BJ322DRAFT_1016127 [Thelephora terrestris]